MKEYITKKTKIIEEELYKLEENTIDAFPHDVWEKALRDPMFSLVRGGGKRLRPVLTCLIGDIYGKNERWISGLAIISEMLHNATLMIDDIEDRSQLRRGSVCAYLEYGTSITLNAGNFWYFRPISLIYSSDLTENKKEKLVKCLIEKMTSLHLGQAMDIFWAEKQKYQVSWEDYQNMSECKTGSMLEFALLMGGILAQVNQPKLSRLSEMAKKMGLAFQIRDDILDITANNEGWGKKINQDLNEGKLTSVIVKTMESAIENDQENLIKLLKIEKKSKNDIKKIKAIILKYDAINILQKMSFDLVKEIKISGRKIMPDNRYREIFFEICDYLVNREK